jgi:hypothetical protein
MNISKDLEVSTEKATCWPCLHLRHLRHPERSEGSRKKDQIPHFVQDDGDGICDVYSMDDVEGLALSRRRRLNQGPRAP